MNEKEEYKVLIDEGIYNINNGKYDIAIDFINQSIKIKNDWDISYFYRGVAFQCLSKFDDAILDYTKAISLNPKMTDAYYNRAQIILKKKNNTKKAVEYAIDDLSSAISLDEKFIDALYLMAVAYMRIEKYHTALEYLEKLLKTEPQAIYARALKKLILQKYIV